MMHPSQDFGAPNEWSVPANPQAAEALLQFAKKYDFEFLPSRPETVLSKPKVERSRGG